MLDLFQKRDKKERKTSLEVREIIRSLTIYYAKPLEKTNSDKYGSTIQFKQLVGTFSIKFRSTESGNKARLLYNL